jgi:hypothetical protein
LINKCIILTWTGGRGPDEEAEGLGPKTAFHREFHSLLGTMKSERLAEKPFGMNALPKEPTLPSLRYPQKT